MTAGLWLGVLWLGGFFVGLGTGYVWGCVSTIKEYLRRRGQ